MDKICPEVLIISNMHDYSTDHIAFQLNKTGIPYLRLNRDQLSDFKISFIPGDQKLFGEADDFYFEIVVNKLKAVYFRAPVYLRDNYQPNLSPDEQLSRSQWEAFIKGLTVYDDVLWVNHPQATYKAEIKPYQLYMAKKIGFDVPDTIVTNTIDTKDVIKKKRMAIKTLDPVILKLNDKEGFIYTNIIDYNELLKADISNAPIILQEALVPKIDIRVTVVGEIIFAVSIMQNNTGIDKDWRLEKDNVCYKNIKLPGKLEDKCISFMNKLDLKFGAIDFALHNGKYYFLEINPTGEWAWLMENAKLEIDKEISRLLLRGARCLVN
jgi:hypothetical protein